MKGIVFDAFGTLVRITNTQRAYAMLLASGTKSEPGIKELLMTSETSLEQLKVRYGVASEVFDTFLQKLKLEQESIEAFPETLAVLESLKKRGIPWVVASNLALPYCDPFLACLGVSEEQVVFSCKAGYMKPQEKIYQLALDRLGLVASDVLMVGDSYRNDVQGPAQLGIKGFHLLRPRLSLHHALDYFDCL